MSECRPPGAISDLMHLPRCLSDAEVKALHDFRALFAEVCAMGRREGAEAMREAVAVVLTSHAGQLRAAAERTWTDVELHSFISGKVGALEVALLAIRALPVPEEMQK